MHAIWISGAPSFVGGADTELHHQIILWRKHHVAVHIVPTGDVNPKMKAQMLDIGCRFLAYRPGIFKDKFVVSYCNGEALKILLRDGEGRPRVFIWFNCMTWTTPEEIEAIKRGLITHVGFVSDYQKSILKAKYVKALGRNHAFPKLIDYSPWLDISQFNVIRKSASFFGIGRISRDDPAKFSPDCWRIFDRVLTPGEKKVFVLGYGPNVEKITGKPPAGLDWQWWTPGAISSREFYSKIDVLIHKTGGSRESYCRVFVEAMAHGVVPLAEDAFAFPELLSRSKALREYLLCKTSDEMSFKASQLAFYPDMLAEMKRACRRYAEIHFSRTKKCIRNWRKLLNEPQGNVISFSTWRNPN